MIYLPCRKTYNISLWIPLTGLAKTPLTMLVSQTLGSHVVLAVTPEFRYLQPGAESHPFKLSFQAQFSCLDSGLQGFPRCCEVSHVVSKTCQPHAIALAALRSPMAPHTQCASNGTRQLSSGTWFKPLVCLDTAYISEALILAGGDVWKGNIQPDCIVSLVNWYSLSFVALAQTTISRPPFFFFPSKSIKKMLVKL